MYPLKCSCPRFRYSPTIPTTPPRNNPQKCTKSTTYDYTEKLLNTPVSCKHPTNKKKPRRKKSVTSNNVKLPPNVSSKQSLSNESKKIKVSIWRFLITLSNGKHGESIVS